MTADIETPYTKAEYETLNDEEKRALRNVAERLSPEAWDECDDETLSATFNVLRPCDGCLPTEEIGEQLLLDIRRKFACIYTAAVELAEEQLKEKGYREFEHFVFCLDIDPSYEDTTHVAILDLEHDKRPFCYFHDYCKAWHFEFESLKDIAEEVIRARDGVLSTFLRLTGLPPEKETP